MRTKQFILTPFFLEAHFVPTGRHNSPRQFRHGPGGHTPSNSTRSNSAISQPSQSTAYHSQIARAIVGSCTSAGGLPGVRFLTTCVEHGAAVRWSTRLAWWELIGFRIRPPLLRFAPGWGPRRQFLGGWTG